MAQAAENLDLTAISMHALMEQVLPFRSSKYLEDFCEKMLGEGIAAPANLLLVSRDALETKLSTHAAFNFIEMADAISLRQAIDRTDKAVNGKTNGNGAKHARSRSPAHARRGRSRSHSPRGRDRGGYRGHSGGRGGQRNNSRPHRGGDRGRGRGGDRGHPGGEKKEKPELWAAVERNDDSAVQQLLASGKDPEEKFQGWTPCMKAAEENCIEVMRMLLEKKVDIEVSNRKGRTALSFAAAPSDNLKTPRATAVGTLRLLLESGADAKRKDERGLTPKDYATKDNRDDALAIFEEFGC